MIDLEVYQEVDRELRNKIEALSRTILLERQQVRLFDNDGEPFEKARTIRKRNRKRAKQRTRRNNS